MAQISPAARRARSTVISFGPTDAWTDGFGATNVNRFWHYDGTWSLEAAPPSEGTLAGTSDSNIWMVGIYTSSGTSLAHFNGSTWSAGGPQWQRQHRS